MINAYILITDLHIAHDKENRIDYFGECLHALESVINISSKYKSYGWRTIGIMLGDVFDGSVTTPGDAMALLELFKYFVGSFDEMYSVVGNHEITYCRDNPYWFCISGVEDGRLSNLKRGIQPKGMQNYFRVVDKLKDGDVVFYFNHYGVEPVCADVGEVRIGLFHQNVGSPEVCRMWGEYTDVESASFVQTYDYLFFGHLHNGKGKFYLTPEHNRCAEWLGTLGRTSVSEVNDGDLEVNVPAVCVDDGRFVGIEDNCVKLMEFGKCVNVSTYEMSKNARRELKERKEKAVADYSGDTLKQALWGRLNGDTLGVLFELCLSSRDELVEEYNKAKDGYVVSVLGVGGAGGVGDVGDVGDA